MGAASFGYAAGYGYAPDLEFLGQTGDEYPAGEKGYGYADNQDDHEGQKKNLVFEAYSRKINHLSIRPNL
jgi:hypothetical protein